MECIGKRIPSSKLPCFQMEHNTAVWTYDILHMLVGTTDVSQVSSAPHSFHRKIEKHHRLRADPVPILIHRTAISTGILITNLLAIAAEAFCLVSSQIPCNLNLCLYSSSSHFFMTQSYHTQSSFLHSSPPFALLRRWRLLELKVE